jgi:hypothetical protein
MERGAMVFDGDADAAVGDFLERLRQTEDADLGWTSHRGGVARVVEVALLDKAGRNTASVDYAEELTVRARVDAHVDVTDVFVSFSLHAGDGTLVFRESTYNEPWARLRAGDSATAEIRLGMALPTGPYTLAVGLHQRPQDLSVRQVQLDVAADRLFHVRGRPLVQGVADLGLGISVEAPASPAKKSARVKPTKRKAASPR